MEEEIKPITTPHAKKAWKTYFRQQAFKTKIRKGLEKKGIDLKKKE